MTEIFGYGIAHKVTGERLLGTGRKAYDGKAAASAGLKRHIAAYIRDSERRPDDVAKMYYGQNPTEFCVVELVCYAPAE